jgi:hypothetical protein
MKFQLILTNLILNFFCKFTIFIIYIIITTDSSLLCPFYESLANKPYILHPLHATCKCELIFTDCERNEPFHILKQQTKLLALAYNCTLWVWLTFSSRCSVTTCFSPLYSLSPCLCKTIVYAFLEIYKFIQQSVEGYFETTCLKETLNIFFKIFMAKTNNNGVQINYSSTIYAFPLLLLNI